MDASCAHRLLPPPRHGEYDVIIPNVDSGEGQFMIRATSDRSSVEFAGYTSLVEVYDTSDSRSYTPNPAQACRVFRQVGDVVLAVDGIDVVHKPFDTILEMIQASNQSPYMFLRMRDMEYSTEHEEEEMTPETKKSRLRYTIDRLGKDMKDQQERLSAIRQELEMRLQELCNLEYADEVSSQGGGPRKDGSAQSPSSLSSLRRSPRLGTTHAHTQSNSKKGREVSLSPNPTAAAKRVKLSSY